eukprot:12690247-Heterocapsa_arctica.AAC.1
MMWGAEQGLNINNAEPSKRVHLDGDAGHETDAGKAEAERDYGEGVREIYKGTSRPHGVPTEVWEEMSAICRQEVIKLNKIAEGKGRGAGTSTDTGGPTDSAIAH